MNLPALSSTEMLLALDLVAGWQVEKVKEIEIWDVLDRCDEPSQAEDDGSVFSGSLCQPKDLYLDDELALEIGSNVIQHMTVELAMQSDGYCIVAWGRQSTRPLPLLRAVINGDHYGQVSCADRGLHCVNSGISVEHPDISNSSIPRCAPGQYC